MDCSTKQVRSHQPTMINGALVERVDSFCYLGVHISHNLSWTNHITTLVKKACRRLYHLRHLKDFKLPTKGLKTFYIRTIENILTGKIIASFGNSTKQDRWALQRGWCDQLSASFALNSLTWNPSTANDAVPKPGRSWRTLAIMVFFLCWGQGNAFAPWWPKLREWGKAS